MKNEPSHPRSQALALERFACIAQAWDILWMTRFAIIRAKPGTNRLPVALHVRNDNHAARLVKLFATCGPLDIHVPQPAITVMRDED